MNKKVRYRLYKTGKRWVVGALVVSLLGPIALPGVVRAEQLTGERISRAATIKKPLIFVDHFSGEEVGRTVTDVPKESTYIVRPPAGYRLHDRESTTIYPKDETPRTFKVYRPETVVSKLVRYTVNNKVVATRMFTGSAFTTQKVIPPHAGYRLEGTILPLSFVDSDPVDVPVLRNPMPFKVVLTDADTGDVLHTKEVLASCGLPYSVESIITAFDNKATYEPAAAQITVGLATEYRVPIQPYKEPVLRQKRLVYQLDGKTVHTYTVNREEGSSYQRDTNLPDRYMLAPGEAPTGQLIDDEDDVVAVVPRTITRDVYFVLPGNIEVGRVQITGGLSDTVTVALPIHLGNYQTAKPSDLQVKLNSTQDYRIVLLSRPLNQYVLQVNYVDVATGAVQHTEDLTGLRKGQQIGLMAYLPAGFQLRTGVSGVHVVDGIMRVDVPVERMADPDPEPEPETPDPEPEPEVPGPEGPEGPGPEVPDPGPEPENPDPEVPDPEPEPETPDPEIPDPGPEPEKPLPPITVPPVTPDPEVDPPGIVPPIGDLLTMREARQVVAVKQSAVLYKDKAAKVKTDRVLGRDTRWQAYREVVDADGQVVGYHLGGEQFVKASDAAVVDMTRGVFTVRHPDKPKWAIATWTTNIRPVRIIKAGSRWQTFGKRQLNDGHWYHDVGGGQYVRAEHGTWQKK